MDEIRRGEGALAHKYEAVFCIFMAAMAYLGRENAELVYPNVLYLFLVLLGLNLSAGLALRRWPSRHGLAASIIMGNCAAITGILYYSGAANSNLWVLYLLPIFTVSLLLGGRETAWITGGALSFNFVFFALWIESWDGAAVFEIALKSGILIFAAALTWRLASAERLSLEKLARQRGELATLAGRNARSERLAEVGLSSAGIVHDLRSPLMVIAGFAKVWLDSKVLDPALRKDLETIRRAAQACQAIAEGVLKAARDEKPALVPCEIGAMVDAAVELCGNTLADAGVEVRRRFHHEAIVVNASAPHLQRVLVNLMTNAAKAMAGGGLLTLKTEVQPRSARVVVEDTGSGMPDEIMENIFKPFNTSRPRTGGTGLGLYVSREILIDHGGRLEVERLPEGGTRFALSLPLNAPAESKTQAPRPASAIGFSGPATTQWEERRPCAGSAASLTVKRTAKGSGRSISRAAAGPS